MPTPESLHIELYPPHWLSHGANGGAYTVMQSSYSSVPAPLDPEVSMPVSFPTSGRKTRQPTPRSKHHNTAQIAGYVAKGSVCGSDCVKAGNLHAGYKLADDDDGRSNTHPSCPQLQAQGIRQSYTYCYPMAYYGQQHFSERLCTLQPCQTSQL